MAERAVATAKKPEVKKTCSNFCKQNIGFNSPGSTADMILQLQRTVGNRAVQKLIKSGALQAKLKIGQPNDVYEQEADRVAEQVMRMPEPQVQRKCDKCEAEPVQMRLAADQITPLVQRQVKPPREMKQQTIGSDWSEIYQQCRREIFGRQNSLSWGGRQVPPLKAVNLILQVTGNGAGEYGPEDLATIWAIEKNFVVHPQNHENPNGSVDIGPVQINYQVHSPGMPQRRKNELFGTNITAGEVFNGIPQANLRYGWLYLQRHGHIGYNPRSQARKGAVNALLPQLKRFFECLPERTYNHIFGA